MKLVLLALLAPPLAAHAQAPPEPRHQDTGAEGGAATQAESPPAVQGPPEAAPDAAEAPEGYRNLTDEEHVSAEPQGPPAEPEAEAEKEFVPTVPQRGEAPDDRVLVREAAGTDTPLLDSVMFYGRLGVRAAFTGGASEIQNDRSRLGIGIARELEAGFTGIARLEVGANLVESNSLLAPDTLAFEENEPAFATRLGWIGADFGSVGTMKAGKQWSVYYDIGEWTDQFYASSARGMGVYGAGRDGGQTGTGRADKALTWRLGQDSVRLGLQAQLRGNTTVDSGAISVIWDATDHWSLGIAQNASKLPVESTENVTNSVSGFSVSYENGATYVAAGVSSQVNNNLLVVGAETFFVDGVGAELYARRQVLSDGSWFSAGLGLYAGGNWLDYRDIPQIASQEIGVRDIIFGVDWSWDPRTLSYLETSLRFGQDALGNDERSTVTIGLRYSF